MDNQGEMRIEAGGSFLFDGTPRWQNGGTLVWSGAGTGIYTFNLKNPVPRSEGVAHATAQAGGTIINAILTVDGTQAIVTTQNLAGGPVDTGFGLTVIRGKRGQ